MYNIEILYKITDYSDYDHRGVMKIKRFYKQSYEWVNKKSLLEV